MSEYGAITENSPVIIVGGGFAGLVAANELKRSGVPFILFEGGESIGGLAQTYIDERGFKFDLGTHLITNRLARELGLEGECSPAVYFGESVWLKNRLYSYPFGLLRNIHYLVGALGSRMHFFRHRAAASLMDRFRYEYGKDMADEVAIPLTEKLTGVAASDLSPETGDKLPGIVQTIYLRLAGFVTGKAVAIGYCMELPERWDVWHVYPNEGLNIISCNLGQRVNEHIRLNAAVEKIIVENEKVSGVQVDGKLIRASVIINTAPVNVLPGLIHGSGRLNYLREFRYSAIVCITILVEGKRVLPNAAVWVPEREYPFFRLTEPTWSMPWLSPEGKSIITVDIGCKTIDETWNYSDKEWLEMVMPHLEKILPSISHRIIGYKAVKTKFGYPVYLKKYESLRKQFLASSGIKGLFSIGRNGEFSHVLMEDVYIRTKKKMKDIISNHFSKDYT